MITFFKLHFISYVHLNIRPCGCMCALVFVSKDDLWESVFSFHHAGSRN